VKIVIGITGSIAAYKAPQLVRDIIKQGAEVRVVMTPSATEFVSPLVLQNLTQYPVAVEMFDKSTQANGSWHIHLARWCDAMLIAPCSAATLANIAHGLSNTALSLVALALPPQKPLILSPAMDTEMWIHPSTQRNVHTLRSDGAFIIEPAEGELASGFHGIGRLPELDVIIQRTTAIARQYIHRHQHSPEQHHDHNNTQIASLHGCTVLLTAGPTFEAIDDVRFIGNHSSGKMGFALAEEAARRGATVLLVSGPVWLPTPPGVQRRDVVSARDMLEAVLEWQSRADVLICAAAVADFTPAHPHKGKLKKQDVGDSLTIELTKTQDILGTLGAMKHNGQTLVGFALESSNAEEYGWNKLREKRCDMIVVNAANKPQSGFRGDDNTITILTRTGERLAFEPMSKHECARVILDKVEALRSHHAH
jgi:phosphopantothenoylcysteine decarboxylase/phosphopantothenate--cysteine ligase